MAYSPYQYGYQPYYTQPVPDQLAQLRQGQVMQQPMMQPPLQPGQMQVTNQPGPVMQPGPVDDRIWVQGESAATAYLVAANGFVRLWDSTAPVFYEKQADGNGKPLPMVVYDYKRRGAEPEAPVSDYDSRLTSIEKRLEAIEKKNTQRRRQTKHESYTDDADVPPVHEPDEGAES